MVWLVRRLGDECRLMFCEKITNQKGGMSRSLVVMEKPFFSPSQIGPFSSSLPLSGFLLSPDNIPFSPSGYEVEIHDELRPDNPPPLKSTHTHTHTHTHTVSITFTMDRTWRACVYLGNAFETHCEDWAFVSTS